MKQNRVLYYFLLCSIVSIVASYLLIDSTYFIFVAILGSLSMLPFIYRTLRDYDNSIKDSLLKDENNNVENKNNVVEECKANINMDNNCETIEPDKHCRNSLNLQIAEVILSSIKEYHSIYRSLLFKSSVYLLFGFVISILGLIVFVYMTLYFKVDLIKTLESLYNIKLGNYIAFSIIQNLPRFGVLFFIEYVALFFLKQFHFLMGECRHYLKIKREIECQYVMICEVY